MPYTILIVDDERDLLRGLERVIDMEIGCRVLVAESSRTALDIIQNHPVDVVLTDIRMPGMDGIALLNAIREIDPAITLIVMTAYGTIENAVEAIKKGAYDFITKPLDEEKLIHLLKKGLELNHLVRENARLVQQLCEHAPLKNMVGQSRPMLRTFETIQMLAKTDVTVLILGQTGTGKELAARAIHDSGNRRNKPMVTVNCPALPESILESELFGYRKGAFTDARENKIGLFQQANSGTIFLDEIGDLSPTLQTKLLRVLQDKRIQPLGAGKSHRVDVRIIAATNQDLKEKIETHEFRQDLFYRLNVATLEMPALQDIREDIPLLVEHFLKKAACEQDMPLKTFSPELHDWLIEKEWPGNIRELENTIKGWNAVTPGPVMTLKDVLPRQSGKLSAAGSHDDLSRPYKDLKSEAIEGFTRNYVYRLLEHTRGNVSLSAKISGIKRQSLQKIIKRYEIPVEKFRTHPPH